jgi:hypothetical protein
VNDIGAKVDTVQGTRNRYLYRPRSTSEANLLRELGPVLFAGVVPVLIFGLIIAGATSNLVAWRPPILQTAQFGTANSGNGITAIGSNPTSIYAAGYVGAVNATPTYLFLNKYDLNENELWSSHFDNPYGSRVWSLSVGTAGVFIVGRSNTTSFLKEYDFSGNRVWNIQFGNWTAFSVSSSPTNVYVAGDDSAPGGGGGTSVIKNYALNGTLLWTRLLPNSNATSDIDVHYVADGVYVAIPGGFLKFDFNGNSVWNQTYSGDRPKIASDSTHTYLAYRSGTPPFDGLLVKYDSEGRQLWSNSFNVPGPDGVESVGVSADPSEVYLAASTGIHASVLKYDPNGNQVWSFELPWEARSVSVTFQGSGVYVGGEIPSDVSVQAFVSQVGKSSSLIFFGLNPPLSFFVLGLLVATAIASTYLFRKLWGKNRRLPTTRGPLATHRIPGDISWST